MIWFQSDDYCWLDKDLNEDIYIHASILTQGNIIPQNSNKKYIQKQIWLQKSGIIIFEFLTMGYGNEGMSKSTCIRYAKGWWNFVRIDRKWFVGINEVPGYLSSEVSLSMVSMVLIQSVTSSSYWPISWASRAAARCCLKSFRTIFSGCFSICHRWKEIQI